MHGGSTPTGEDAPSYKHGAYSTFQEFQRENLTDREQAAIDAIDFEDHDQDFAADVVREAYAKYLRTGDDRFLREARQWAKEFGVIDRPADQLEVSADVEQSTTHELDDDTRAVVREVLGRRREVTGDE